MAKTTRARSSRPNNGSNGQRSPNVCVSSSCMSSSSDDEQDYPDNVTYGSNGNMSNSTSTRANGSWASNNPRPRTSSSDAGDFNGNSRPRTKYHLGDANVEGGRPRPKRDAVLSRHTNSVPSKRKWEDDEDFNSLRKGQKCFSRNAVMARLNRIKKKHHLESLENDVSKLSEENKALKGTLDIQNKTVSSLKNRVRYLESVLANSSEISMLLKNIQTTTGLPAINSLQKSSKLSAFNGQSHFPRSGFPPPQLDHIYSRTPDVTMCGPDTLSTEEENLCFANSIEIEDDDQMPSNNVTLPFMPLDDNLFDIDILSPNSDDMFTADFPDYNQHFEDDDKLLSDVGICLHIAKKRVSLEFCSTCNNNAVDAWDAKSIFSPN